jgi:hypothetical protein
VKKKSKKSATVRSAKRPTKPLPERRQMRGLREVLDDLITHVRDTSRRVEEMAPSELEYAQERMQWLVDEVWRLVLEGGDETL